MNKKGVVLSLETVLLIVLSISVLTILVIFLNSQTGFLSNFIDNFRNKVNVDDIVVSCNSLVATERSYNYCCETKKVIFDKEKPALKLTCDALRDEDFISGRVGGLDCSATICRG
tara:strand:- start:217 stop:561 length:345 start_codon:yes stop_codon:yes gene_type:complete